MHALQFTLTHLTHAEHSFIHSEQLFILELRGNKQRLTENKQNSTSTITRDTCIY